MKGTSTGALNEELDTYIWNFLQINPDKSRHDVPWDELLKHTNKQFLPSNDKEYVRESLENFRQVSGESMRDYTRKFRDLSEQGFPSVERSPDQVRTLIRFFIKGLNSADIAKTVLKASPASVSEAMSAAIDAAEMEETLHRLGHRKEEPGLDPEGAFAGGGGRPSNAAERAPRDPRAVPRWGPGAMPLEALEF